MAAAGRGGTWHSDLWSRGRDFQRRNSLADEAPGRAMKGQQKTAEAEEGTVQIQEGAVATGEDPTSVAIASIQSAATFPDPNVKYVFRTENGGQVMYRVIQVSEGQLDGQTEGTGAISGYPATQSMTQAVIQGAFTSDDAVDTEGTAAETHYTYFPGGSVGDGSGGTASGSTAAVVTTQGSEALLGQATPPGTGETLKDGGGSGGALLLILCSPKTWSPPVFLILSILPNLPFLSSPSFPSFFLLPHPLHTPPAPLPLTSPFFLPVFPSSLSSLSSPPFLLSSLSWGRQRATSPA